jgi:hypothetical protein
LDLVGPRLTEERVLLDFDMSETGEHFEATGKVRVVRVVQGL